MFRVGQILTPTKFIKNFKTIASHLAQYPQALLVTQRSGRHLVVMDAELFDQMMERAHQNSFEIPQDTALKYQLEANY